METAPLVKGSKVETTPAAKGSLVRKEKKEGGCPSWLWPLLGILALLALILGLLFGLGVFGRIANGNNAKANLKTDQGGVEPTAASTSRPSSTVTPTIVTPTITPATTTPTSTVNPVSTPTFTTTPVTIIPDTTTPSTVIPATIAPVTVVPAATTAPTTYTVIEETTISKKNKANQTSAQTQPFTSPTIDVTPTPVVIPTAATLPTTSVGEDFGIDPTGFSPAPVAGTTTNVIAPAPPTTVAPV